MTNGALTKLTDALADHFEDVGLSRTIVRRVGIEDRLVDYGSLPVVRWPKIVELAIEQKKLELLVDTADELRGNPSLRELFDEWNAPPVTPPTPEPPRKRLPYPWLTPWVGREREMAALEEALRASRLVTLHGTGGVGKTRLAVETLLARGDVSPREMVFVALENASDKPEAVLTAVRDALGLTEVDAPDLDVLCRRLHGTDLLLLLDNFESVMSAAALVQRLAGTVGVRVLVTSQRALDITGERVVELDPMPSKTKDVLSTLESFRLFVELARHGDPKWQPEDNDAMREVLVATDGLPYLIELVAAAAPKRRLRQLANELKSQLKKVRARHALVERQSSVQACLEWALTRLPIEERNALPRLAIFAGSFADAAALEIASTSIESLDVLVDASLLRLDREAGRYSMLSTTRQFAREVLNDEERTHLAGTHARWFIERLEQANNALRAKGGETQTAARRWIDTDSDNVQQAVEWMEAKEPKLFQRAVFAYTLYLGQTSRFSEDVRLNEALLRRLSLKETPDVWATTQNNLGEAYRTLPTGDWAENLAKAIACYEAALSVWNEHDSPEKWAAVQNNLGIASSDLPTGDGSENRAKAITCYEAALRVWNERDFPEKWATAKNNLGTAYSELSSGDHKENLANAIACYVAALRIRTERDFPGDWAVTQNNLGNAYSQLPADDRNENLEKAIACYVAALRVRTERDFPMQWAITQHNLALVYEELTVGDLAENRRRAILCHELAASGYAAAGLTDKAERARQSAAALADGA